VLQQALQHNEEQRRLALLRGREQTTLQVCVWETERERKSETDVVCVCVCVCGCACVCGCVFVCLALLRGREQTTLQVWESERERERKRDRYCGCVCGGCVCVCVCVCVLVCIALLRSRADYIPGVCVFERECVCMCECESVFVWVFVCTFDLFTVTSRLLPRCVCESEWKGGRLGVCETKGFSVLVSTLCGWTRWLLGSEYKS